MAAGGGAVLLGILSVRLAHARKGTAAAVHPDQPGVRRRPPGERAVERGLHLRHVPADRRTEHAPTAHGAVADVRVVGVAGSSTATSTILPATLAAAATAAAVRSGGTAAPGTDPIRRAVVATRPALRAAAAHLHLHRPGRALRLGSPDASPVVRRRRRRHPNLNGHSLRHHNSAGTSLLACHRSRNRPSTSTVRACPCRNASLSRCLAGPSSCRTRWRNSDANARSGPSDAGRAAAIASNTAAS
eukprot:ctg_2616.g458